MNWVFWMLVILVAVLIWFALAVFFRKIGKYAKKGKEELKIYLGNEDNIKVENKESKNE